MLRPFALLIAAAAIAAIAFALWHTLMVPLNASSVAGPDTTVETGEEAANPPLRLSKQFARLRDGSLAADSGNSAASHQTPSRNRILGLALFAGGVIIAFVCGLISTGARRVNKTTEREARLRANYLEQQLSEAMQKVSRTQSALNDSDANTQRLSAEHEQAIGQSAGRAADLAAQVDELRQSLAHAQTRHNETSLAHATDIARLRAASDASEHDHAHETQALEADIESLREDLANAREDGDKAVLLTAELRASADTIAALQADIVHWNEDWQAIESDLNSRDQLVDELQSRLDRQSVEIDGAEAAANDTSEALRLLTEQHESLQLNSASQQARNVELENQLNSHSLSTTQLQDSLDHERKQKLAVEQQLAEALEEQRSLQATAETRLLELEQVQLRLNERQQSLDDSNATVIRLRADIEQREQDAAQLLAEIDQSANAIRALQALNAQESKQKESVALQLHDASETAERTAQTIVCLEERIEELETIQTESQERDRQQTEMLRDSGQKIAQLAGDIELERETGAQLANQQAGLRQALKEAANDLQASMDTARQQHIEMASLKESRQAAIEESLHLRETQKQARSEVTALHEQVQQLLQNAQQDEQTIRTFEQQLLAAAEAGTQWQTREVALLAANGQLEQANSTSQHELQQAHNQVQALQEQLAQSANRIGTLEQQFDDAQQQQALYDAALVELQASRTETVLLKDDNAQAIQKINQLERDNDELTTLRSKADEQAQQLQRVAEKIEQTEAANTALTLKLQTANSAAEEAAALLTARESALADNAERIAQLADEQRRSGEREAELRAQTSEQRNLVAEQSEAAARQARDIAALRSQIDVLDQVTGEAEQLRIEQALWQEKTKQLEQQLNTAEAMTSKLLAGIGDLTGEEPSRENWPERLATLADNDKRQRAQLSESQALSASLDTRLAAREAHIEALEKQKHTDAGRLRKETDRLTETTLERDQAVAQINEFQQRIANAEQAQSELAMQWDEAQNQLTTTQQTIQQKANRIGALEADLQALQQQHADTQVSTASLQDRLDERDSQLDTLTSQQRKLQQSLDTSQRERHELAEEAAQLWQAAQDDEDIIDSLRRQLDELHDARTQLKYGIAQSQKDLADQNRKLVDQQQLNDSLGESLTTAEASRDTLQKDNELLHAQLLDTRQLADSADQLAGQIDKLEQRLQQSEQNNAQLAFALEGWKKAAAARNREQALPTLTAVVAESSQDSND